MRLRIFSFTRYLILMMYVSILSTSCSKKDLIVYDQSNLGSSIYFYENYNKSQITSQSVSFGYVASDVTDSIIKIPISVTGSPSDTDRTFSVQIDTSSTMQEGTDFDFYTPLKIRAGLVMDTMQVILYRTTALKDTTLTLRLHLVANDNFNISLPYYGSSTSSSNSLLSYNISVNDIAGQSYLWTGSMKSFVNSYFGSYSLAKVQLMMSVLDLSSSVFFDNTTNITTALIIGWASYMKQWLATEKAAGRIYYDESGKEITMGTYAS